MYTNEGTVRRIEAAFRMVSEFGGEYSWRVERTAPGGGYHNIELARAEQNIIELTIDGRTITQAMRSGDPRSVAARLANAIEREL